jgi:hypothetical protein
LLSYVAVEHPIGVMRHDAMHAGGGSQPEGRHGMAAEVLMIGRRRKAHYGGFWVNIAVPNIF